MATKTGKILADMLSQLLAESSEIEGAAVIGIDGLVYSANMPYREMDEDLTGAAAAAIFALGVRSVSQLKRGKLSRVLVQGDDGNIIVTVINKEALFVALTPKAINLGMAFAEVKNVSAKLAEVLQTVI